MNRISCENARRLMPLYLSSELTGDRLAEFSDHLSTCGACFGEVERQIVSDRELRDAMPEEPRAAAVVEAHFRKQLNRERWLRGWAVSGVAAAVAVAAVALFVSDHLVRPLEAAARDHAVEVLQKQPRRWSTGNDIRDLAVQARISPAIVPDLTKAGYVLNRARLCRLDGEVWLHLVYLGTRREISLFLRPGDEGAPTRLIPVDDLSVGAFVFSGVRASLVTDSREECRSIGNRIRTGAL